MEETLYLVTAWLDGEMVGQLWADVEKYGHLKSSAELRAMQVKEDMTFWGNYICTVKQITSSEYEKAIRV